MAIWRRDGNGGRLARAVAHGAISTLGYVARNHKRSRSSNSSDAMANITLNSEKPARVTYRRRRESRRHKSRRIRDAKAHVREDLAMVSPQRFVKYSRVVMAPLAGGQTMVFLQPMYSLRGTLDTSDDLYKMSRTMDTDLSISLINSIPSADEASRRLYFNSARLTCEIVNLQTALSAYLTVYEYVCKDAVGYADMNTLWSNQKQWGNTTGYPVTTLNATPWDYEEVMGKIIIMKKTEILLAPGSTQEYEMSDTQNKMFDGRSFDALAGTGAANVGKAGWTKGLIVVVCGPASASANAESLPTGVVFFQTIRYSCKFLLDETAIPSTAQVV